MTPANPSVQEQLKRRAAELAKKPQQENVVAETMEVIPFQLASEQYALQLRYIREIIPLNTLLPIPHTPPFISGVTNVHGEICSVVDLKKLFSLPAGGLTNLNKLIILEDDDMSFGLLADDVLGSIRLAKDDLSSVENWHGIDSSCITGITPDRLIVLNAKKILTDKRLIINETPDT